jgi:hypothetical protein
MDNSQFLSTHQTNSSSPSYQLKLYVQAGIVKQWWRIPFTHLGVADVNFFFRPNLYDLAHLFRSRLICCPGDCGTPEALSTRMARLIGSDSRAPQTLAKQGHFSGQWVKEDEAMWWKVLWMIIIIWANILVGYGIYVRGRKLYARGEKLMEKGGISVMRGEELLADGQSLWEKGQILRMRGIELMRDVENAIDDQWWITDEAERMILQSEAMIDDSVGKMDEGCAMVQRGEYTLGRGRDLVDKGEEMMDEGRMLTSYRESFVRTA